MAKYLFVIFTFFSGALYAQNNLQFNKRFVESEDRWVAFDKGKDSTYSYGFIYIDDQAGLTYNYEGDFTISANGTYMPKKTEMALKVRLQANNVKVAFIPESKFEELKIDAVPDWLKYYKTDTASVKWLYGRGYMYNGWNECAKALTYLEKAQKLDAHFKGLSTELAFSYNCLKEYDKAASVLRDEIKANPTDGYTNKELVYALAHSGKPEEAAAACRKALAVCPDEYKGEMCYNVSEGYYRKKDKDNFKIWAAETRKWAASNSQIAKALNAIETDLAK